MINLEDIIAAGVARFETTLPDYARGPVADIEPARPNITLSEERQVAICLNCPLADCIGIESRQCPIQIEQRAEWRKRR